MGDTRSDQENAKRNSRGLFERPKGSGVWWVCYFDEQGRVWGSPGAPARMPLLKDGVAQKAWFCGPPAEVIAGIKSVEAKYPGLENFMIHWAEGLPPQEFKEQLRWFAKEVLPAFKRT